MAFDAFLKIATIPGESTDDQHKDWIEIAAYSLGIEQRSGGSRSDAGAASGGRADFKEFNVVKNLDKGSPKLMLACAKGEHIKEVIVELARATGDKQKYMEYKLSDVLISYVRPSGDESKGSSSVPTEEIGFNYGKIEMTYFVTDHKTGKAGGQVAANWDLTTNKGG